MNKKVKSFIAVYAIVLVLWSVIFFVVPFEKNVPSVISYIFSVISIAAGLWITNYSFSMGENIKSKVYGFPVFRVGAVYAAAQIIFTLIIAVIGSFAAVPVWITVVVSIVFAGLAAIGVIAADNARDVITQQESEDKARQKNVKRFRLDMESIVDKCSDAELKKKLAKLSEEFKYSDPVSNDELAEIENRITDEIAVLDGLVCSDAAAASEKTDEIARMLADRNRRCKAMK